MLPAPRERRGPHTAFKFRNKAQDNVTVVKKPHLVLINLLFTVWPMG
jgi:hypothetical protein